MILTTTNKRFIADNIGKIPVKEMAAKIGCSQNHIYKFIAKYNRDPDIVNKEGRQGGNGSIPLTDEEKQYIRENINKCKNKHFIHKFKITGTTLYKFIREENLRPIKSVSKDQPKQGYFQHDDYYRLLAW